MFLKERQDAIAEQIQTDGRVTVSDLAQRYDVSEDCIRKDLKTLAEEGRCKKVYGGAIRVEAAPDRNIFHRIGVRTDEKRRIAEQSYELIGDGDTVFLDVSTTNIALAELLAAGTKRCIVVSNMIDLLQILAQNPLLKVLSTGGTVNLELNGFVGTMTVDALAPMRFNKSFIGALGIDMETGGVLTFDVDDAAVKRTALARTETPYLVADLQKFGAPGNYEFASVADFTALITDEPNEGLEAAVADLGGRILEG